MRLPLLIHTSIVVNVYETVLLVHALVILDLESVQALDQLLLDVHI
jgi:hypothetical protein